MQKRSPDSYLLPHVQEAHQLNPEFPIKALRWEMRKEPIRDLHAHNCLELGLCHSGSGLFLVDKRVFHFQAGSCVILAPNVFHRAKSQTSASHWTFLFLDPVRLFAAQILHPGLLNLGSLGGAKFPYVVPPGEYTGVKALLEEVITELKDAAPHARKCVHGLVIALLVRLQRLPGRTCAPPSHQAELLRRLDLALKLMLENIGSPWTIAEVARACHMSAPSFRRNFRHALGCSPKFYQVQLCVHAAAARLESEDKKVLTVALECGFNSLSAFNRNFKALLGVCPKTWRQGIHSIPKKRKDDGQHCYKPSRLSGG